MAAWRESNGETIPQKPASISGSFKTKEQFLKIKKKNTTVQNFVLIPP